MLLHPGALCGRPSLHSFTPSLVAGRIAQELATNSQSDAIHRPGITPLSPALQPQRLGDGIPQPQTGDAAAASGGATTPATTSGGDVAGVTTPARADAAAADALATPQTTGADSPADH